MALKYPSFILKLSGEALGEETRGGLSARSAAQAVRAIRKAWEEGARIGVVVGAGNLWRGAGSQAEAFDRTVSHHIGLVGTIMNALALAELLRSDGVPTQVYSALPVREIVPVLDIPKARKDFQEKTVLVFGGGTGNPYFTTDSAAALRAVELGASVILKATTVDGVYSADPKKDPQAKRYESLTFDEALSQNLKVMDATAFDLCRESKIPIVVFNMNEPGALVRVIQGKKVGTLVSV